MLLDYRLRQRDFLLEISRAITAQLDLSEVLRRVLQASLAMLAGQIGVILLRDAAGAYHIQAVVGVEAAKLELLTTRITDFLRRAALLSAAEAEAQLAAIAADIDPRMKQNFALPLIFAGDSQGVLLVFRNYSIPATPDDLLVLGSFADQAAIAVHNAQLYERIDHERRRLSAILQYSADGVLILDGDRRITGVNAAFERLSGWSAADAIGRDHDAVITFQRLEGGDLNAGLAAGVFDALAADGAVNTLYVEGDLMRRDGVPVSVGIRYAPLFTADGGLTTIIANLRDITNFRQAQEMQNVFISMISHELKTPVAIIKGNAATLAREDADWDAATVRAVADVIEDESDRLAMLIENLLMTSKMQAQRRLDLMIEDVSLPLLASRAIERFASQTQQHTLAHDFPPDFPVVPGDPQRLRQVFDNLISNAIKYSPNGGVIRIDGAYDDHWVTVRVRDQGIGMSNSEREHVFERFYRADSSLSRRTQGTGLGLYLTKAIVEAHGGWVEVDSAPGRGSTFAFTLPRG